MVTVIEEDPGISWGSAGDPFFPSYEVPQPQPNALLFPGNDLEPTQHARARSRTAPSSLLASSAPSAFSSTAPRPVPTPQGSSNSLNSFDKTGGLPTPSPSPSSSSFLLNDRAIPISNSPSYASQASHPYRRRRVRSDRSEDVDELGSSYDEEKKMHTEAKDYLMRRGRRNGLANLLETAPVRGSGGTREFAGSPRSLPTFPASPPEFFLFASPTDSTNVLSRSVEEFQARLAQMEHIHHPSFSTNFPSHSQQQQLESTTTTNQYQQRPPLPLHSNMSAHASNNNNNYSPNVGSSCIFDISFGTTPPVLPNTHNSDPPSSFNDDSSSSSSSTPHHHNYYTRSSSKKIFVDVPEDFEERFREIRVSEKS